MTTEDSEFGPSRRDFLAGLISTSTVFIAGCGGGSAGDATPGMTSTSPPPGTPPTIANVPVVVARNLGPQPAAGAGVDPGIKFTARISAALGGQFDIAGGARLAIPPGALAADTDIEVVIPTRQVAGQNSFLFGPEGLRFATPAQLAMPMPAASDLSVLFAIHSSVLNPIVDVGSEKTNFQPLKAVSRTATHITFELEHFSFLHAAEAIDAGAYLVTDIPGENLTPGDLMFYLTYETTSQRQWRPGHVAMLVKDDGGRPDNPRVKRTPGLLVEAGGAGGGTSAGVAFGTIDETKFAYSHTYLGPYRHPQGLTKDEQDIVRQFLYSKLGKPYALLGVQGTPIDLLVEEAYSCVGLCDAALRAVGKGLVSVLNREFASTPIEMIRAVVPVTEIEVKAEQKLEIPVYGVIVSASALGNVPVVARMGLVEYSRRVPYDVAPLKFPRDSTFVATPLQASVDPNDRAPGYLFTWFPRKEQIGQVFELELELVTQRTNLTQLEGLVRDSTRRLIKMKVVPGTTFRYLDQVVADRFVNIGKDGTIVYGWTDTAGDGQTRRRMNRLNPPVGTSGYAPETVLDIDTRVQLVDGNLNNVVLAQFDERPTLMTVRHTLLVYTVAAGASQNPTTLATVNVTFPPDAPGVNPPGVDYEYIARSISSNGDVVGTFLRLRTPRPGVTGSDRDLWWIPKGGALTTPRVLEALYAAIVSSKPQPGITRGDGAFDLRVLDSNSAGAVLVAAMVLHVSASGTNGVEVFAASYNLNTGQVTLLAYIFEQGVSPSDSGAIRSGRINDLGQAVICRADSIRGGGLVTQYHEGFPATQQPKAGALTTRSNFWPNTFNSKGIAGGFTVIDGVSKAALWNPATYDLIDVHAQLKSLDTDVRDSDASSVARLGDDGTIVGRVIMRRLRVPSQPEGPDNREVETVKDFVIKPG